ncbi:hypothetical protein [Alteromonas gilva]|uniref:Uncharacterized protein n=1 Tax=Alteromonas gilva TaxID=2987522 RepID=A0ABT5L3A1_9ALTE|nr:hypothetical protein [Alteromonas gilva]MDC8831332.1 hypothetical protein [Alteromonas gilva]
MPVKKWLRQYAIALPVLCGIFTLSQYLKGHALEDALAFAVFWACVSLVIFALTRAYNFHQNRYCALCNDLPGNTASDGVTKTVNPRHTSNERSNDS